MIDNTVDTTTGTIRLKATFDNEKRILWPGTFVDVSLTLDTQGRAIVVPSEAVQPGQQGQMVCVVKDGEAVEPRTVTVGATPSTAIKSIIQKGIAAGETVVTDGQLRLFPGARIKPVPAANRFGDAVKPCTSRALFIERPVTTALVMLAILLFGIVGYRALPVAALPSVDYPTIQVSASFARRESGDHGLGRGHSARAPILHHRRRRVHELEQFAGHARLSLFSSTLTAISMQRRRTCRRPSPRPAGSCRPTCRVLLPIKRSIPSDNPVFYLALTSETLPFTPWTSTPKHCSPSASRR